MAALNKKVIIACGGTGGHLFPGVAVAQELKSRGHQVVLLISEKKVDASASSKYGKNLDFETLSAVAKPPTFSLKMIPFLYRFWKTKRYCSRLIKRVKADVVLGMGGFTSMPPVMAGKSLGLKCLIHESNALPGRANRLTAKYCDKVLLGMKAAMDYFPSHSVVISGTPVRKELENLPSRLEAAKKLGLDPAKKTVMVMGGSQGARRLNSLVIEASKAMPELQFIHLTGGYDYERIKDELGNCKRHLLIEFCEEMADVYALSDLAVCRSGASSMTELAYVGIPSILVPYPFAADDHQTFNAKEFEKYGASVIKSENDLDGGSLVAEIAAILDCDTKLEKMKLACDNVTVRDAAKQICLAIENCFLENE